MDKIALLIIYNHRYDKNIELLEQIYSQRFTHIFHVMPFYDGERKNVIAVYENSFYFEGYIAQAYQHLKAQDFTHYFVVADDMLLNPKIDETNLFDVAGFDRARPFVWELNHLWNKQYPWYHIIDAIAYNPKKLGVEVTNILPSAKAVRERINDYNLATKNYIPLWFLIKLLRRKRTKRLCLAILKSLFTFRWRIAIKYPLIGGYSDVLLLPKEVMPQFVSYLGAFAATDLFVELAIPTSLIMCSKDVTTKRDILLPKSLHSSRDDYSILDKYNFDYEKLVRDFPEQHLFIHPIKLSKWKKEK